MARPSAPDPAQMGFMPPDSVFKALSDPTRRHILVILSQPEHFCRNDEQSVDGICVRDLAAILNLPQSTVSRHLAVLNQSGLVRVARQGLWHYYSLQEHELGTVGAWVASLLAGVQP